MGYHFKGDADAMSASLDAAGARGLVNVGEARGTVAYKRIVSLLGQASTADPAHAAAIVEGAKKSALTLLVAYDSAERMIDEAEAKLGLKKPEAATFTEDADTGVPDDGDDL